MVFRVLITDVVDPHISAALSNMGFVVEEQPDITNEALLEIVEHYAGLIISTKTIVDRQLLDRASLLKFIGRVGSGMEHVDLSYCTEKGVQCFSSPEGNANAVGEHCLGLLLSVLNNISKSHHELQEGVWQREVNRGEELDGKTVGIIGFGHTGPSFVRKLQGFDVKVLVYDKYKEVVNTSTVRSADMNEILERSDIISFHVPYNKETHQWINRQFLESCRKNIILLNTSRGAIAHTPDLLWGLQEGKLAGLGIDVFEDEPVTLGKFYDPSLYETIIKHPRVVATPHIAGWSRQSKLLLATVLMGKISAWWDSARG